MFVFNGLLPRDTAMHVIFGHELYGQVDDVPGKCHVATRFFHLYYFPLIPTSTWVIQKGPASIAGEQQIHFSWKSSCVGWLMAFLVVFGVTATFRSGLNLYIGFPGVDPVYAWFEFTTSVLSISVWLLFLFRPLRASPERAYELLTQLGLSTEGIDPEQCDFDSTEYNQDVSKWTHTSSH